MLAAVGAAVFVEILDGLIVEGGFEDGDFVHAAVEVADGEVGVFAEGLAPVADLGVADVEGVGEEFGLDVFHRDALAVDEVGGDAVLGVEDGGEVEPLAAHREVPHWRGEVDVVVAAL